jgi:hypothetical protein
MKIWLKYTCSTDKFYFEAELLLFQLKFLPEKVESLLKLKPSFFKQIFNSTSKSFRSKYSWLKVLKVAKQNLHKNLNDFHCPFRQELVQPYFKSGYRELNLTTSEHSIFRVRILFFRI